MLKRERFTLWEILGQIFYGRVRFNLVINH